MKRVRFLCFIVFFSSHVILNLYGQTIILGSKQRGTDVDQFIPPSGEFINGFTVSASAEYAVLTAWATDGSSGEIFRTKLKGMEIDGFTPASGLIDAFSIGGPDGNGYAHLIAHSSSGESDTIFSSKLPGTGVNDFTAAAGEYVNGIDTLLDVNGYNYLVVNSALAILEVTGFAAVPGKNCVLLKWRTEVEQNSYQWLIQRKVVDGNYMIAGKVDAQGNASYPTDYRYEDKEVAFGGCYFYRLVGIDTDGESSYFGPLFVDLTTIEYLPRKIFIEQNYPNPFKRMTSIKFGIPLKSRNDDILLAIYDMTGRLTRILVTGKIEPGYHHVIWDGRNEAGREVSSGVYFYTLSVGEKRSTEKMIHIK